MQTALTAIQNWLKTNPLVFSSRLDDKVLTLIERASQKQIVIDTARVVDFRVTPNPQGFGHYINLVFDDGHEIVLCHAGLAFAPSFASTGPLPDAPPVACMTDYQRLFATLDELTADPTRHAHAILLFQVLISILEGARVVGLDVGAEEEALNAKLTAFEYLSSLRGT